MHHIKRAIILAAGIGNRLQPLTLEIPKPLIPVNGTSMIETIIQGLLFNGIQELYIVIGYLKERFYHLKEQYPQITFIENPFFDSCNNISSLYVAREHLENAIILDGDQLIYNPSILTASFERSGYNCIWTDTWTKEWLLTLEQGIVTHCSRDGGDSGWQLYSISRWTAEDGKKLRRHLEIEFIQNEQRQLYWDDVVLFCHHDEYQLGIFEMKSDDVIEIDTLSELIQLDNSYGGNLNER